MQAVKEWLSKRNAGLEGILFCLGVFLKPFYIFPSGSIGLGDGCMALCACILLGKRIAGKKGLGLARKDTLLYGFLACVCVINGSYYLKFHNQEYLLFTAYWLYAGMIVWSFRQIGGLPTTGLLLKNILQVSLVLQTAVWILGWGRIYYEYWGATRYMGTFNNPNQMAYIIFLMILLLYFYERKRLLFWIFWLIGGILIIVTKSTGVFLGWICLGIFDGIVFLYLFCKKKKGWRIAWRLFWCFAAAGTAIGLWLIWPPSNFQIENTDYSLLARIQEKIYKVWTGGLKGLIYDRGWERLILYPRYLLFGAGEGDYGRFPLSIWKSEIHSTFLSVWFYYGAVPLILYLGWMCQNLKDGLTNYWPAYAALFLECMIVINYRQPFFWMVLLAGCIINKTTFGGNHEAGSRFMGTMDEIRRGRFGDQAGIRRNRRK